MVINKFKAVNYINNCHNHQPLKFSYIAGVSLIFGWFRLW